MSKLAQKIAKATGVTIPADIDPTTRTLPGPRPVCYGLYEHPPDIEDWAVVQGLREGRDWHETQTELHRILGIVKSLPRDKFRYHWLRHCSCWPADLRI